MAMALPLLAAAGSAIGSAGASAASALAGNVGIGSAISAAATGLGTLASFQAQKGQAKAMSAEADARRRAAALDAAQQRRKNRVIAARDRASLGQSGVLSGSSFNLLLQNTVQRELDVLTQQNNTNLTADTLSANARSTRSQAGWGLAGGVLNTAGQLLDPLNFGLEPTAAGA